MTQTSRLVIELDSRDAEAKAADTRKALEALEDAGLRIQPALNKAGAGMEKMGKGAEKASKSIEDETDELERLLGQIDPVVRRLGELDKQEQDLAKHRKAGKLDTATYDEYKAKIEATRKGLTSFDDSLTRTGNTAKQTAAALRGVPAQFTDIAVSLQCQVLTGFRFDQMLSFDKSLALIWPTGIHSGFHGMAPFRLMPSAETVPSRRRKAVTKPSMTPFVKTTP